MFLKKIVLLSISLLALLATALGQVEKKHQYLQLNKMLHLNDRNVEVTNRITQHSKLVAVGLNLSLGLFGVHRLYLGTSPKIPVIYTFTLGGGGVLLLGDLGALLFTKDIEQYADKQELVMW